MGLQISNAFAPGITIKSGISPTGTYSISTNGLQDIIDYSTINVNVPDLLDVRLTSKLNLSIYSNNQLTYITPYAFTYQILSAINTPNVREIGEGAFCSTSYLSSINFPVCTTIGSAAFYGCASMLTASLPNLKMVPSSAFGYCSYLTSIELPQCSSIGYQAFIRCYRLSQVSIPQCISTSYFAFGYCSSLTTIALPNCQCIEQYTFAYCSNLQTVELGSACNKISYAAFSNCFHLLSLYLNVTSVPTLYGTTTFTSTPLSNYTTSTGGAYGSIYVPSSLYSAFITANNWSLFSARMVSM